MNNQLIPYQTKFAAPGSSLYYSLLPLPPWQREKMLVGRALTGEWANIAFNSTDSQPAQAKFAWWQCELQALSQRPAAHPLLQMLQALEMQASLPSFMAILEAFRRDFSIAVYDSEAHLQEFYAQTAGLAEACLGQYSGCSAEAAGASGLQEWGIFIQRVRHLRDLRRALQYRRCYLSSEQLVHHHVTLAQLTRWQMTDAIRELLRAQAKCARVYYQRACQLLPTTWRKIMAPAVISGRIHAALLDEIEKADFPVLTQHLDLTPLRKWWISWKNR